MNSRDQRHLKFIYDRLLNVHQEDANYDYMRRLREIIGDIPEPHSAPSGHRGIMELKKEHLEALEIFVLHDPLTRTAATFEKANEALEILKQVFGASSKDLITLYPTIG